MKALVSKASRDGDGKETPDTITVRPASARQGINRINVAKILVVGVFIALAAGYAAIGVGSAQRAPARSDGPANA
ncbi:MAG: hypothetical protein H0T60_05075, partial [Acidobacteria bacterium]|nr:hypothetical protein [Acidobacteriota bacterium]